MAAGARTRPRSLAARCVSITARASNLSAPPLVRPRSTAAQKAVRKRSVDGVLADGSSTDKGSFGQQALSSSACRRWLRQRGCAAKRRERGARLRGACGWAAAARALLARPPQPISCSEQQRTQAPAASAHVAAGAAWRMRAHAGRLRLCGAAKALLARPLQPICRSEQQRTQALAVSARVRRVGGVADARACGARAAWRRQRERSSLARGS